MTKFLFEVKTHQPQVQAAIIIAFTTIITVVLGFMIKDYWIPGLIERRTKTKTGQELFKRYKSQLFKSANSFASRLHEIYKTRSLYLLTERPKSEFYDYKYKSSVYRLCVLFGWIRAYRLEESAITIKKTDKEIHIISQAINNLESSFADGQGVEMYVTQAICNIAGISINHVNEDTFKRFGVGIDDLVHKFKSTHKVEYISDLKEAEKDRFFEDLCELIKKNDLSNNITIEAKEEMLKKASVKLGLIYRDWQQGIGDLMLEKSKDIHSKSYRIIGYKKFEELWDDKDSKEKIWLTRAERIFENLDLSVDHSTDSRIQQLQKVYENVYGLLNELYNINVGIKPISLKAFQKIPKTIV